MIEATLLYLVKGDEILLAEKGRKIGAGKVNGVGGKMEPSDKNITATMIREAIEEIGVTPTKFQKMAEMVFYNPGDGEDPKPQEMRVHVFVATEWKGEPTSTIEAKTPRWFNKNGLPFERMLPDDKFWLPRVLGGEKLVGKFYFNDDWTIEKYELSEVSEFGDE
ncbi:MAG: 8-oxo-dGTP diphosphatase [Candidatus Nomurabacteria bacterium]|jgi:8-oxo-dGTP pyrophosphatase MutT (NUDIX family)|nr:8-oxo-dGTP diphosphatase [Candidatus Nomurabacteria bacterium]